MKVLLMDTQHYEVLQTLLRLFGQYGHELKVYTTAGSQAQLAAALAGHHLQPHWEIQQPGESRTSFALRFSKDLRTGSYDLVALVTVADNHLIIARALKGMKGQRSMLTIHSLNGYFIYKPSFSLKRLVRYFGKNQLVKNAGTVHVLSHGVAAEFRKLADKASPDKKVIVIPGSIYDHGRFTQARLDKGKSIRIVLPGAVDERRRNYDEVFALLEQARASGLDLTIILLGAIQPHYSERVQQQISDYRLLHDNLVSFGHADIDQPLFDEYMQSAHFIWMPFKEAMVIQDGVMENYGRSMNSGNLGDAIRYAKPFFVPAFIGIDPGLREVAHRYTTAAEILPVLQSLDEATYDNMQARSLEVSANYALEKLTALHPSLFRDLLT